MKLNDPPGVMARGAGLTRQLADALRIHHEWCVKHQPGYSEHGSDAVAYRSTAALLERAHGVAMGGEAQGETP